MAQVPIDVSGQLPNDVPKVINEEEEEEEQEEHVTRQEDQGEGTPQGASFSHCCVKVRDIIMNYDSSSTPSCSEAFPTFCSHFPTFNFKECLFKFF